MKENDVITDGTAKFIIKKIVCTILYHETIKEIA